VKSEEVSGFSDNPFMIGYDSRIFEEDEDFGFKFPEGKIITEDCFVDLDFIIQNTKRNTGYPVILNMGDSSTSGWNGNKVFQGNEDPNTPFFTYKTYSDILREHPTYQKTINAGVPGYTSLQGRKYLERLLKRLSREGIHVDYVTFYFGNNDSTYNGLEDKVRLEGKAESPQADGERVTIKDFERNLESMINTAREYGAKPIIIIPPIHYDWEPGIRSDDHREESLEALKKIEGTELARELDSARKAYEKRDYKKSCELDRVIPRLKPPYRKALRKIGRKTRTPIIDVQKRIPFTDNAEYFADYCHPLGKINRAISEQIDAIINKYLFHKSISERVKEFINTLKKNKKGDSRAPPSDIYTLH
jgi:lysophospholipase L1-like esterase